MTTQCLLLSVVPILLTCPAWASPCANQDSCAGQGQMAMDQALGEVGGCGTASHTSIVGQGRCPDACIGSCQSTSAQPPQMDSQTLSLLYVLIQTQACQTIGAVHASCGVMRGTWSMGLGCVQMPLP